MNTENQIQTTERRKAKMEEQIVKNVTERANSHEFGKAGNRFKIYFEDAKDLKAKMDELKQFGFIEQIENE